MPPLAEPSCRQLLNQMNAGNVDLAFGTHDADVMLPMSLVSSGYHIHHIEKERGVVIDYIFQGTDGVL